MPLAFVFVVVLGVDVFTSPCCFAEVFESPFVALVVRPGVVGSVITVVVERVTLGFFEGVA